MNKNGSERQKKWGVDLNRNFPTNFGSTLLITNVRNSSFCLI